MTSGGLAEQNAAPGDASRPIATAPISLASAAGWSLLFFLLSLVMNLPWLNAGPLAGTEGHRALTAHEMVRSGHWITPILYHRVYLAKPPFHHWLIAISETLSGRANVFFWRLPSALGGAMLAAICCSFGIRWFGKIPGIISGVCCLALIAIWGEHQVADIDSTNTLTATLAAFCALEALRRPGLAGAGWVVAAGLAAGASLMTKGPAGVPIIAGVLLAEPVLALFDGRIAMSRRIGAALRLLVRPRGWMPLVIGLAILALYAAAARHDMQVRHLTPDFSGVSEGTQSLYPTTMRQLAKALILPPTLFVFALPMSLALPLLAWRAVRDAIGDEGRGEITFNLAGAVLIAWGLGLLSGMINPRYAYPTLPALCPLAGIVAVSAVRLGGRLPSMIRLIGVVFAIAFAIVALVTSVLIWKLAGFPMVATMASLGAIGVAAWIVRGLATHANVADASRIGSPWRACWGFAPLILLVSVPFGIQRAVARQRSSGVHIADAILKITGPHPTIDQGASLTFKPEIFYYADADSTAFMPARFMPQNVPPGHWAFLTNQEYEMWKRALGDRLTDVHIVAHGGNTTYYLARYLPSASATDAQGK